MAEIGVRCFDCRAVIANKIQTYQLLLQNSPSTLRASQLSPALYEKVCAHVRDLHPRKLIEPRVALNVLGIKRLCCRTRFLTYVDIPQSDLRALEERYPHVQYINQTPANAPFVGRKRSMDVVGVGAGASLKRKHSPDFVATRDADADASAAPGESASASASDGACGGPDGIPSASACAGPGESVGASAGPDGSASASAGVCGGPGESASAVARRLSKAIRAR